VRRSRKLPFTRSLAITLSILTLIPFQNSTARAALQCKESTVETVCKSVTDSFESFASGQGGQTCKIGNEIKTNLGREECLNELNANFSQIGAQCDALSKMKEGRARQITFAALHSSMAAACLIPCICGASGVGKPFCQASEVACAGGSLALSATELGIAVAMAIKTDDYASLAGSAMGVVGITLSSIALADAIKGLSGAGKSAGTKAGAVLSACLPFAMETLTSGIQWFNLQKNGEMYQEQCGSTSEFLTSNGQLAVAAGVSAEELAAASAQSLAGAVAFDPSSQTDFDRALDSAESELADITKLSQDVFSNSASYQSAATALGESQKGMGKLFDPKKLGTLKANLKSLGIDPVKLTQAAAKNGISQALQSQLGPNLNADERKRLKEMLADVGKLRAQILKANNGGSGFYSGALAKGRAKPSSKPEWSGFGAMGEGTEGGAAPAASTLQFSGAASGKRSRAEELGWRPDDSDEWHASFRGSLFDLITLRVQRSRSRTERLEWEDPLNRASHGLDKKSPAEPARSTQWDF
jgi:hypothetical protein